MPSPFPGIDPYLEGSRWPSVQTQLSIEIARELAPVLRPKYVVRTPRRAYERRNLPSALWMLVDRHFPGVTVEVLVPADGALVTVIDILLATDKEEGRGREAYLSRRKRLLEAPVHLVEIDLLRSGEYIPLAVPVPLGEGDHDALLNLDRTFKTVHSLFGYDLDVQYARGPEIPLDADQLNWAQRMVQMWKDERE